MLEVRILLAPALLILLLLMHKPGHPHECDGNKLFKIKSLKIVAVYAVHSDSDGITGWVPRAGDKLQHATCHLVI